MKLTLLGSGDFRIDSPVASAGYIVETPQALIKLDFGRGNLMHMAKLGIDWRKLNAILISHIHPDHIGDLMQYLQVFALFRHQRKLNTDIPLFGPKGFENYFDHFRRLVDVPWTHIPAVRELIEERITLGDCTITTLPMKHSAENNAYRIESGGRILCYTGDTELNDNLFELASGAHVLLVECTFRNSDAQGGGHLRPTDIARVARECGVRTVVLTHYPAEAQEREHRLKETIAECPATTVIAGEDCMILEV